MKIGFISLGCPKNQLDTEVMLHHLASAGYEITPEETEADIVIINTCAFIESAKKEAIDNILDIAYLKKHHSLNGIIVTGCMSERYGKDILEEFPEVDAVVGISDYGRIGDILEQVRDGEKVYVFGEKESHSMEGKRIISTLPSSFKRSSALLSLPL